MVMGWMRLGWMLGLAAAVLGCGSGSTPPSTTAKGGIPRLIERPKVQNELKQIHIYHQLYITQNGRPPRNLDELNQQMEPNSREYQALRDGRYVVNWNADQAQASSNKVLAYEKDADANGERYVVMTDGSIQRMTQQQFDAANR